jgi:hypothetical protein
MTVSHLYIDPIFPRKNIPQHSTIADFATEAKHEIYVWDTFVKQSQAKVSILVTQQQNTAVIGPY